MIVDIKIGEAMKRVEDAAVTLYAGCDLTDRELYIAVRDIVDCQNRVFRPTEPILSADVKRIAVWVRTQIK